MCAQVPQYLLEDASLADAGSRCNVVCTQPRRIAAMSVAERCVVNLPLDRADPDLSY